MRNMKRFMRITPLRRLLAIALCMLLCMNCALGEADLPVDADLYVDDGYTAIGLNLSADLVVGYVGSINASVNPFRCNNRDLASLNQLVFESVVELDENLKPTPLLADSWTRQGNVWTFQLRSGIQFHNGSELTAADVVSSYQRLLQAGSSSPYYARLALIKDVQATDLLTLQVTGTYDGYLTLYGMTFPVVQLSTLEDDMPRGTGPYWFTQYIGNEGVRLERNPLWWKKDPQIESVVAVRFDESGDALEALHTNEIDLLCSQSSHAALSRKLSKFTSMDYHTNIYELMIPNLSSSSVMSDVRMRQAVMYAVDRAQVSENAYLGMGIQCEVPVNPASWLYESQSAIYYYSPERALQLAQECGWRDLTGDGMLNQLDGVILKDLTVNIITYNEPTTSIRENAANMIATYLNNVGIHTKVEVLSPSKVSERIDARNYDIALVGMNLSEVPNLVPLLYLGGNLNLNGYGNDDMKRLLQQSVSVSDEDELKSVYSEIQMTIVNKLPIMGLLFRTGTVLSSRSLAGLNGIRAADMLNGIEFMSK